MRCQYCGRYGHLKSYYCKLYGSPIPIIQSRKGKTDEKNKKIWVPKLYNSAHLADIPIRASAIYIWYIDSGYSRHMTGVKNCLMNMIPHSKKYVTLGDGAKGELKEIGKPTCTELSLGSDLILGSWPTFWSISGPWPSFSSVTKF